MFNSGDIIYKRTKSQLFEISNWKCVGNSCEISEMMLEPGIAQPSMRAEALRVAKISREVTEQKPGKYISKFINERKKGEGSWEENARGRL